MKYHWLIAGVLLLLLGLGAAGCGGEATPRAPQAAPTATQPGSMQTPGAPQAAPTATQPGSTQTRGVERALPTPTTPTSTSPVGPAGTTPESATGGTEVTPPAGAQEVVRLAKEDLAQRLGVAVDQIQLVSVEAVDWSDTSLGCPQPGMMYAQVITPGYRVILGAGGERYEYHTDTGRFVVLCEKGEPSGAAPSKGVDTTVQDGWPSRPRDSNVVIRPPIK